MEDWVVNNIGGGGKHIFAQRKPFFSFVLCNITHSSINSTNTAIFYFHSISYFIHTFLFLFLPSVSEVKDGRSLKQCQNQAFSFWCDDFQLRSKSWSSCCAHTLFVFILYHILLIWVVYIYGLRIRNWLVFVCRFFQFCTALEHFISISMYVAIVNFTGCNLFVSKTTYKHSTKAFHIRFCSTKVKEKAVCNECKAIISYTISNIKWLKFICAEWMSALQKHFLNNVISLFKSWVKTN